MIQRGVPLRFSLVQLGDLQRAEAENTAGLANQVQRAFQFEFDHRDFPLGPRYRLPNSAFDLDAAAASILTRSAFRRPVIILTSAPYCDRANRRKKGYCYFADYCVNRDCSVAVISTHLWTTLPGDRRLQPYVLLNFAAVALSYCAGLEMHDETRGCVFDYCDEPSDIDRAFKVQTLCGECERHLNTALRQGCVRLDQIAAARRLLNRAMQRRQAFVVMPFQRRLESAYKLITGVLEEAGWNVLRADKISRPRRITDAIVQAILTSDLVVADLTDSNPNVFYELGLAHAAGCDVIMLTQEKKIPFDITTERAVFYRPHERGMKALESEFRAVAGLDA